MNFLACLVIVLLPLTTFAFRAPLSPEQIEKLKNGEQLERVEELKDEVFPRVTLITVIPHSPKENMAVFSDYEKQKDYVPGLLASKIVRRDGNSTDVAFEMHMPGPISNSEYTTRNTVVTEGKAEILTWELVKSKEVKRTTGTVAFEPFEDRTLFTYTSHITPNSSLAWMVKSRVLPDVKKNVRAVIEYLAKHAGKPGP